MQNYLGWEELDEQQPPPVADAPTDTVAARLAVLMRERARLEEHMMRLLGKAPKHADEAREQALFPMPIHTAESRMEDRRVAREEERARAAARRALEAARIEALEEQERAQHRRDREREAIQRELLQYVESLRKAERRQDRARALLAEELIRNRWAGQREIARQARDDARRQESMLIEQRSIQGRRAAMARCSARRDEFAHLEARLSERAGQVARRRAVQHEQGLAAFTVDD